MFREQTDQEKKDFRNLMSKTNRPLDVFRQKVEPIRHSFIHEKKKPFCYRCARLDFIDKMEKTIKEAERTGNFDMDLDVQDLTPYSEESRFELIGEQKAMEPVNIGGIKSMQQDGIHRDYKCKIRGCGISINLKAGELNVKTAN